jgi:hypothetical protein
MARDDRLRLVTRELTVENTTFCGAKCVMCPRESYSFQWRHMPLDLFETIIEQAVELGMSSLDACGFGDPLMDPGFQAKLEYVKTKHPAVKVYTSTTGQLLHGEALGWVCRCIDTLKISNFGFSKEVYEAIHGGALKYEKVMSNIEALLALPRPQRPYVIMLFLVFPENEHQIDRWKAYWEPKVEEIVVWLPHNYGGGRDYGHQDVVEQRKLTPRSCGRPFRGNLFVRENGEVSMCCFDFDRKLLIGDLRTQTLAEVLAGEPMAKLRAVHEKGDFENHDYICKGCDQLYPRDDALLYATNSDRKAGVLTSHPDLINDLLIVRSAHDSRSGGTS